MKIEGWEKISGYTYKGYSIVNPIHNANEDTYYATILNLNQSHKPKWDMILKTTNGSDIITFRIEDSLTKHLMATSGLTKENIRSLQKFREEYELLIDDILETAILSKVVRNVNGGTTGIINQVQNAGSSVSYGLPKSGSLSHQNIQSQLVQQLKELQEQLDKINSK
jgi:hypothetical protein